MFHIHACCKCFKCFICLLQLFHLDIIYVCNGFQLFFRCFASVSDVCCKCFNCFHIYDVGVSSGCCKSRFGIAHVAMGPTCCTCRVMSRRHGPTAGAPTSGRRRASEKPSVGMGAHVVGCVKNRRSGLLLLRAAPCDMLKLASSDLSEQNDTLKRRVKQNELRFVRAELENYRFINRFIPLTEYIWL